jgi:hypothetical protein
MLSIILDERPLWSNSYGNIVPCAVGHMNTPTDSTSAISDIREFPPKQSLAEVLGWLLAFANSHP